MGYITPSSFLLFPFSSVPGFVSSPRWSCLPLRPPCILTTACWRQASSLLSCIQSIHIPRSWGPDPALLASLDMWYCTCCLRLNAAHRLCGTHHASSASQLGSSCPVSLTSPPPPPHLHLKHHPSANLLWAKALLFFLTRFCARPFELVCLPMVTLCHPPRRGHHHRCQFTAVVCIQLKAWLHGAMLPFFGSIHGRLTLGVHPLLTLAPCLPSLTAPSRRRRSCLPPTQSAWTLGCSYHA